MPARSARGHVHVRRVRSRCAVLALSVWTVACGGGSAGDSTSTPASRPAQAADLPIVAPGDSETTGAGDPTGLGWVGRYARLLRKDLGASVRVENLAADGKTSEELLSEVRSDPATR